MSMHGEPFESLPKREPVRRVSRVMTPRLRGQFAVMSLLGNLSNMKLQLANVLDPSIEITALSRESLGKALQSKAPEIWQLLSKVNDRLTDEGFNPNKEN